MDKVSLLKSLRSIYAMLEHGHGKQSLGALIGRINKPKRAELEELATRKQLMASARNWLEVQSSAGVQTEQEERAVTIIQQFLSDEVNFVVDRDTKKQLSQIVLGQIGNIMRLHPDYFTEKGKKSFDNSLTKRLVGDIHAYMKRMALTQEIRFNCNGTAK